MGKRNRKTAMAGRGSLYEAIGFLIRVAWILLVILAAYVFVIGVTIQHGTSMEPAFRNTDTVLFYRLEHEFESGDAVVFQGKDGSQLVGRIVAVPGDQVDITDDGLKVNGYYQTEKYASGEMVLYERGPEYPLELGPKEYFILTDHRDEGEDSRLLGGIPEKNICGRVMLSIRKRDF